MKKILLFLPALFFNLNSFAQNQQQHVKWTGEYKATTATEGEIVLTALIEKDWHTYSQKQSDGPLPMSFTFSPTQEYEKIGETLESAPHEEFDKTFETKVLAFTGKAEFKQKVKLKMQNAVIQVFVEYMCCNNAMCMLEGPVRIPIMTDKKK